MFKIWIPAIIISARHEFKRPVKLTKTRSGPRWSAKMHPEKLGLFLYVLCLSRPLLKGVQNANLDKRHRSCRPSFVFYVRITARASAVPLESLGRQTSQSSRGTKATTCQAALQVVTWTRRANFEYRKLCVFLWNEPAYGSMQLRPWRERKCSADKLRPGQNNGTGFVCAGASNTSPTVVVEAPRPSTAMTETRTARGAWRFQTHTSKAQLVESHGRTVWKPLRPRNAEARARQLRVRQTTNERIATWTSTVFASQNLPQEFCHSFAFCRWFKPFTNLFLQSWSKLRPAVHPHANRSLPSSHRYNEPKLPR